MPPESPLIITPCLPPTTGRDASGVNARLSLFVTALSQHGHVVRILRMVPPNICAEWSGKEAELDQKERVFWGAPVEVTLACRRSRQESFFSHYIRGLWDPEDLPDYHAFSSPRIRMSIGQQLRQPTNLVFLHRTASVVASPAGIVKRCPTIIDLDDIDHKLKSRTAFHPPFWPGKLLYLLQALQILRLERTASWNASATLVCSERDKKYLQGKGFKNVFSIPNAVEIPDTSFGCEDDGKTILFLGLMDYHPNARAAERLITSIMPLIWRRIPDATLVLAGKGSDRLSTDQSQGHIERLGFVEDLSRLYNRVTLVCSPILTGGGTRIKLIEAAAHRKPIVSTTVGAEGLDFVPGAEIAIADSDDAIADQCVNLLRLVELRDTLAKAAFERLRLHYARSTVLEQISSLLRHCEDGF